MTVLSYPDGKPLDWNAVAKNPDRVSKMVMWNKRSIYGDVVRGSLFFICALDTMNTKAIAKFGHGVDIIQTAYNNDVAASEGTHDYDDCIDWEIAGVSVFEAQHFARFNCGMADWGRTPAQGFPYHNHGFFLPPGGHVFPFKVGYFIDGGRSLGRSGFSSQIVDYWNNAYGLAGEHNSGQDHTPFPSQTAKMAGIFKLDNYIQKQRELTMEYKDWSDVSKKAAANDAADAVITKLQNANVIDRKDANGKVQEKVSLIGAVQRLLNR